LTFVTVELPSKRMQLLKDAVPIAKRVAVVWSPNDAINKLELEKATAAAEALGLTPPPIEAANVVLFCATVAQMPQVASRDSAYTRQTHQQNIGQVPLG
jgi:ABC-type uncharacterized transport system substrate-binding protein